MSNFMSPPEDQTCAKCQKRPGTAWWAGEGGVIAIVHGFYEARCAYCCVEEQLEYARKLAATIPELEAKLAELQAEEGH